MYTRDAYNRTVWVEVPDPLNPPPDAESLSAENLNNLEAGVLANRDSIHSSVYPLVEDEFTEDQPFDEFHDATVNAGPVTSVNWPYSGMLDQHKGASESVQRLSSSEGIFYRVALASSRNGWLSNTAYSVGDEVQPNQANGLYYVVSTAGTSGASEPLWATSGSTSDGSVVWSIGGNFWSDWQNSLSMTSLDDAVLTGTRTATPSSVRSLVSTDTITPDAENKLVSSSAAITLSSVPTIPDGSDGQVMTLLNSGINDIALQDEGTLAGSNLRLSSTTLSLSQYDSVSLVYLSVAGAWVQITNRVAII